MMSKQIGDADRRRQQMTGEIPQRGTAELSGVSASVYQNSQPKLDALRRLMLKLSAQVTTK